MTTEAQSTQRLTSRGIPELLALAAAATCIVIVLNKQPGLYRAALGLAYLAPLLLIAATDLRTLRAPNRIVYPTLSFMIVASLTLGWQDASTALLGGLVAFAVMLVIAIAGRGAMGYGDVKVGTLCGLVVGLTGVLPMMLMTFVGGSLVAILLLLLRVRTMKDPVAFTPFLVAATIISLTIFQLYLWR